MLCAELGPCSPVSLSPASVPTCPELTKRCIFCFLRSALNSVSGEATALGTTGEIWRGRMFQRTPGPGFQRVKFITSITCNEVS